MIIFWCCKSVSTAACFGFASARTDVRVGSGTRCCLVPEGRDEPKGRAGKERFCLLSTAARPDIPRHREAEAWCQAAKGIPTKLEPWVRWRGINYRSRRRIRGTTFPEDTRPGALHRRQM
jgi:hypothetical protein